MMSTVMTILIFMLKILVGVVLAAIVASIVGIAIRENEKDK